MIKLKDILNEDYDYRSSHRAPSKDDGPTSVPLHDLDSGDVYTDVIYSHKALTLFGTGFADNKTFNIIQSVKDKPNAPVTIYRAVPPNVDEINPGDWVSITKEYAITHKNNSGEPDWKIISKKVKASHVYTSGDSWDEWGYDPN
jgi:hypothetical protein